MDFCSEFGSLYSDFIESSCYFSSTSLLLPSMFYFCSWFLLKWVFKNWMAIFKSPTPEHPCRYPIISCLLSLTGISILNYIEVGTLNSALPIRISFLPRFHASSLACFSLPLRPSLKVKISLNTGLLFFHIVLETLPVSLFKKILTYVWYLGCKNINCLA